MLKSSSSNEGVDRNLGRTLVIGTVALAVALSWIVRTTTSIARPDPAPWRYLDESLEVREAPRSGWPEAMLDPEHDPGMVSLFNFDIPCSEIGQWIGGPIPTLSVPPPGLSNEVCMIWTSDQQDVSDRPLPPDGHRIVEVTRWYIPDDIDHIGAMLQRPAWARGALSLTLFVNPMWTAEMIAEEALNAPMQGVDEPWWTALELSHGRVTVERMTHEHVNVTWVHEAPYGYGSASLTGYYLPSQMVAWSDSAIVIE